MTWGNTIKDCRSSKQSQGKATWESITLRWTIITNQRAIGIIRQLIKALWGVLVLKETIKW